MPDKWYKRNCGASCLRCWRNRLKHGNKEAKAFIKAHPELDWGVHSASRKPTRRSTQQQQQRRQLKFKLDELYGQHARGARARREDTRTPQQMAEMLARLADL